MGHDLITIYFLKAVEYILALSYLPLFILFWRFVNPKQPVLAVAAVPAPGWADQLREFFQLPADVFFHPGHTWARLVGTDTVAIGIDGFAQKLVGSTATLSLPAVGLRLAQGAPALGMTAHGRSVSLLSPVDGTVVEVNPAAAGSPATLHGSPYADDWLVKVRTPTLASNLKNLLSGDLARRWMDAACERLGTEIAGLELGHVYTDGGVPVDGIAPGLSPDRWDEMASRHFLTAPGGHRA